MILSETDVLSALAKVGRLDLLYSLFEVEQFYIVPAVLHELEVARTKQYTFAATIFNYIENRRLAVLVPTPSESAFAKTLPATLGAGERDSITVAHHRNSALLCNESRVAHVSRQLGIEYLDIPLLLRALWVKKVLTQDEVRQLVADLYTHDQMKLSARNLVAIFAYRE